MKTFLGLFLLFILVPTHATEVRGGEQKIIYKYKQYEKFDFEDLVVEGETGSPGDLSIIPRYQRKFKNKLPYKRNFIPEMKKGIERIQ